MSTITLPSPLPLPSSCHRDHHQVAEMTRARIDIMSFSGRQHTACAPPQSPTANLRSELLDLAGELLGSVGFFLIIAMIVLVCCLADVPPAMAAEAAESIEATSWVPLIVAAVFLLVGLGVIALGLFVCRTPLPEYDGRTRLRRDPPRARIDLSL
ncbi:MAG: hypothetical protein JWM36_4373 [Hyphomicrobiales bacterium]|nr:hypothetical protein [Hyphomicrobiales bacterium]